MRATRRLLFLIPATFLYIIMTVAADAAENNCLKCHGEKVIMNKGVHLYLDPAKYALTTHARIGCLSCHEKVSKRHPTDGLRPPRAACKDCHVSVFEEYNKSLHGNKAGCADCHNPHAVKPLLTVSGRDINIQCAKCHDYSKTVASHSQWLPQAALHIDALPCITCHTGSQNYVITLYIAKNEATAEPGGFRLAGFEDFKPVLPSGKKASSLIDVNGDGFITLDELKNFNKNSKYQNLSLMGTMMPEVITHSYQILNNRWDCTFCHVSGTKALQTSFLAFPESDGTYSRVAVEKGAILDALYGTPDFYMLGATRSAALSVIGALIAAGGLMVPILHGTVRLLTRKRRKEQ